MFKSDRWCKRWNTRYAGKQAGCIDPHGAIVIKITGQSDFAHRLIWKMKTNEEHEDIDHRDLDPSNNKFDNLRPAEHCQNLCNVAGYGVSGLKGVYFSAKCIKKPWFVVVNKSNKPHRGGFFATKEEAFAVACSLREELHGEFARHGADA
jgi:hypothetical protein